MGGEQGLRKALVNFSKDNGTAKGTKGISQPVAGVISCSVFEKGLVEFIPNSNQGKRDGNYDDKA